MECSLLAHFGIDNPEIGGCQKTEVEPYLAFKLRISPNLVSKRDGSKQRNLAFGNIRLPFTNG